MKPDKNYFLVRFKQVGSPNFFMELKNNSLEEIKNPDSTYVHMELLKISNHFFSEFRKTNAEQYKDLSILFKRVANIVYRELRRTNRTKFNSSFLNLMKIKKG